MQLLIVNVNVTVNVTVNVNVNVNSRQLILFIHSLINNIIIISLNNLTNFAINLKF